MSSKCGYKKISAPMLNVQNTCLYFYEEIINFTKKFASTKCQNLQILLGIDQF